MPNPAAAAVDVHDHDVCVERAKSCMRGSVAAFGATPFAHAIDALFPHECRDIITMMRLDHSHGNAHQH